MSTRPLMEVSGFRELQDKIKLLASDKQKRTEILKILRKVAQGTVKAARREAPISKKAHTVSGKRTKKRIQPGALRKSIGVITGKRNRADNPVVYVGPRAKGNFDGFYGAFVELGHNIYRKGFKRKHSGSKRARRYNATGATAKTRANKYMGRTFSQTKGQVTEETVQSVTNYLQKRINALSR